MSAKDIGDVLRRYKFSIIFTAIFFLMLAVIYSYFKPNIYRSDASIEVKAEDTKATKNDIVALATGGAPANIDNVIQILQSRHMVLKALKNLNVSVRYFTKDHMKTVELYKNSPFIVSVAGMTKKAQRSTFQLIPISKTSFRLVVEPPLKQKIYRNIASYISLMPLGEKPISYDKVHHYGEQIDTPWFTIAIQKIFEPAHAKYSFVVVPNMDMLAYIQNHLTVQPASQMGTIVNLALEDRVALRAKDVLDALVNSYISETLQEKTKSAQKRLQFIDAQLAAIHKVLEKSAKKLQKFKSSNIITNIGEKATMTSEKVSDLQTKMYDINMRLGVLKNILHYIKTHKDIKGIDVDASQALSPAISSLILKIQEANEKRTSLLTDYTELHPDVIKVTKQLESLKQSLEEALRSAIFSLENQKKTLQNIIEQNKKMLQQLPSQERKLAKLSRSFMVNEKIYSYLLQKRAETAIVEASTVPKARIIDAPIYPENHIKPKRLLIIVVGLVFGLVLGIAFAFFRNSIDDTIKTSEDLDKLTKIPLYGAIPYLNGRKNLGVFHEALRVVRTNLEFLQNSGKSKVITITSSIPKEGKTTVTTELSKIIAKSGKKTIILDLDMRQSKVYKKFNIPNKIGLSTYLAGKNNLKEVVQKTGIDDLYAITSGPVPPNPSELLMSESFKSLVDILKQEYDYILFDSPPIGLVTDAMIAMRMSHINLIVLRSGYSKKNFLKNINRFVEEHELKAGLILNAIKVSGNKGAYGYGYGVSYGYSSKYYR